MGQTLVSGSVGSIEASIPSGLCSGSLGGEEEAEPETEELSQQRHHHHQHHHHHHAESSLAGLQASLRLQDLQSPDDEDIAAVQDAASQQQQIQVAGQQSQLVGEFSTSFWVDDMAGFPLPPLDLDPLPPGLFSPCSGTYK